MRVRVEAADGELEGKGHALLERLADATSEAAPGLSKALQTAAEELEPAHDPRDAAIRELVQQVRGQYARQIGLMLAEIGQALDAHVDEMAGVQTPPRSVG